MNSPLSYWDLDQKTRAALSEAEVERYVDFELMSKGVLKAPKLELVEEPSADLRHRTLYAIKVGYTRLDVAFDSAEDAERFISDGGAYYLGTEFIGGRTDQYSESLDDGTEGVVIEPVRLALKASFEGARAAVEKKHAAQSENERRKRDHEKAVKAERDALQGLWSDWHECRELDTRMRRTVETFEDYKRTCGGDATIAGRFLAKVFSREQIAEAAEWCGVEIPVPEELLGREVAQRTPIEPDNFATDF